MRGIAFADRLRRRARQEDVRQAVPAVKTGERPYPDTIAANQVTAYRLAAVSEYFVPKPEFHAAPFTSPDTAPMPAVPANAMTPPPPAAPAPVASEPLLRPVPVPSADTPELADLLRVRNAMLRKWRAESFLADRRELPCFRATTRVRGWQGLHMPPAYMADSTQGTGQFRPALPAGDTR
jgi:hypothetical protein